MVTSTVNIVPIPDYSKNKKSNILPTLGSIASRPEPEESKKGKLLSAPNNLAPLGSKSRGALPPLSLPGARQSQPDNSHVLFPESKLSIIPNMETDYETEFESSNTQVPKENSNLDEIKALMGH